MVEEILQVFAIGYGAGLGLVLIAVLVRKGRG